MVRRIGIIGGGIAGLVTAKTLRQFGHDVMVFEKESEVGGVWASSRRYPGLTTQNPRETYAFADFPMPSSYPEWPSGTQMQAYLESYVDHFGFRSAIRLGSQVLNVAPAGPRWRIAVRDVETGGESDQIVDVVIVCNGIFSIPSIPQFPGSDAFRNAGGQILHTSEFTDIDLVNRRHALVIGYGKSSCDAAVAIARTAASTRVVARHLIWKIPKKIGNVVNFKHLFLNRMGEGLFRYINVRGFERFLHGPGLPLRNSMLGTVQGIISRQLGLRRIGLEPAGKLETIARSTVSLVTDGFYEGVADGSIGFSNGEIVELTAGEARLSDGSTVPADVIVCGTGWHQRCDFLAPEVLAKVTDKRGNFRLYRSVVPVGVPGLLFNGYNSSFFSQLNAEVGALWIADFLGGGIRLPSEAEQNAYVDSRLAWMEARTDGKHSKGTNIIPFSIHHIDELLHEMKLQLPLLMRLKHWFVAIDAADYGGLLPRLMKRHGVPAKRPAASAARNTAHA
ncbi:flavin-containing monooxygenase [Novosphingobium cyanobacteriorum]|uniref:Trimethylamine monooxygenase n=1 Tax=Novosphingobium cyanobacteriorum TaxID=3024215 RepID=A0ABT6CDL8_9SPHN|nr:NAD(P)/FAD-dependent oxidoreductase [Novosphingobium cyanobacteriorum]MDF8331917.1 NAD(P)/FAD-dependent oxidoreductase [Novosphingobium cyanobacteriorum]